MMLRTGLVAVLVLLLFACSDTKRKRERESYYDPTLVTDHGSSIQRGLPLPNRVLRDGVSIVDKPDTSSRNAHYISNQPPLAPSVLIKLPVGSIKPKGWLLEYLQRQKAGLTGNLGEISAWLQKEGNAWLSKDGLGEWGWEEVPYWLKGYANIGYILKDEAMISEARIWLDSALGSQRKNGDFGPVHNFDDGTRDYWANMIMLFNLQSWYEHSGDQRVIELMKRYFKHLSTVPDEKYLTHYWQRMRGGDTLHSVFWLYNRTQESWLLELAHKVHRNTADWSRLGHLPNLHNVNIAQAFREPATWYLLSGDPAHLEASYDNLNHIRSRFGQVPGGMWGGDEVSRDGFDDPHQAIETCAVVEQLFSNEMMLWITGDPYWADHAEEVAFNTAPATTLADYRGLRYLTAPNHIVSDAESHAPGLSNSGPFLLMSALSSRCCQHNHSQGWPYYAENLWMATPDNGVAAILYAASEVAVTVAGGDEITLSLGGNYPFAEQITITLATDAADKTIKFPLYLRVPSWSRRTSVLIDGEVIAVGATAAGRYLRIERDWRNGDVVTLNLPMDVAVRRWARNHKAASVELGPLTFSLKIAENYIRRDADTTAIHDSKWRQDVDLGDWPAYEIQPGSPWNYGLVLDEDNPAAGFEVVWKPWPADNFPFTQPAVPVSIYAQGKQIAAWGIDEHGLAGALQDSPISADAPVQRIELIPMGAARLRISAFPVIGDSDDARAWQGGAEGG